MEDEQLRTLLARILELCHSAGCAMSCLCATQSQSTSCYWALRARCSLVLARDFVVRLLRSGVKPTITGDLWSENGMGLFGIYTMRTV